MGRRVASYGRLGAGKDLCDEAVLLGVGLLDLELHRVHGLSHNEAVACSTQGSVSESGWSIIPQGQTCGGVCRMCAATFAHRAVRLHEVGFEVGVEEVASHTLDGIPVVGQCEIDTALHCEE